MAITTTLTPPPTAPSRNDPDNFRAEADAWVDWLTNDFHAEVDAVIDEINSTETNINAIEDNAVLSASNASASESIAMSSANFYGEWDDLSGAATVPYSVYHSSKFWMLLSNLADVTAKEPGVDVEWAEIVLKPTMPTDTRTSNTMLNINDRGKLIQFTSGTFTQTFDAAANIMDGWFVYLQNVGTGVITLDPNGSETIDGNATIILYSGESRLIQCDGNVFTSILTNQRVLDYIAKTDNYTLTADDHIVEITSAAFNDVYTLPDATNLRAGKYFEVKNYSSSSLAIADNTGSLLGLLGAGKTTVIYLKTPGTQAGTWTASAKDNTLLPGKYIRQGDLTTLRASQTISKAIALGSDKFLYVSGHNTELVAMVVTADSDYGITTGSVTTLTGETIASNLQNTRLFALGSGKYLFVWAPYSSAYIKGIVLSVSGDTVTAGSSTNIACSYASNPFSVSYANGICVVAYLSAENAASIVACAVSGDTVGAPGSAASAGGVGAITCVSVSLESATAGVVCVANGTGGPTGAYFSLSGTTITAETPISLGTVVSSPIGVISRGSGSYIAVIEGPSSVNYLHVNRLAVSGTTLSVADAGNYYAQTCTNTGEIAFQSVSDTVLLFSYYSIIYGYITATTGRPLISPATGVADYAGLVSATRIYSYPGAVPGYISNVSTPFTGALSSTYCSAADVPKGFFSFFELSGTNRFIAFSPHTTAQICSWEE